MRVDEAIYVCENGGISNYVLLCCWKRLMELIELYYYSG